MKLRKIPLKLQKIPLISEQSVANVGKTSRYKIKLTYKVLGIRPAFTPTGQKKLSFEQFSRIVEHLTIERAAHNLPDDAQEAAVVHD